MDDKLVKVSFVFTVIRVYYCTDSVPPDNQCPILFLWLIMTRHCVHVSDHAGL